VVFLIFPPASCRLFTNCKSLRKARDIRCCLAFLKRVILHEFGTVLSPDFVMMDADEADTRRVNLSFKEPRF
jgi:hypothetical protein